MLSQNKQILHHLKSNGSITPIEALNEYGCFRLAARIKDLRDEGHNISTNIVYYDNQYTKSFACYTLINMAEANNG